MNTTTLLLLLEELTTILVLEKRFVGLLRSNSKNKELISIRLSHEHAIQQLEEQLRAFEKFTQPGHRGL